MKKSVLLLLLLTTIPLLAARREGSRFDEIPRDDPSSALFTRAQRVIPFADGSRFVVTLAPTATDPKAITGALVMSDRTIHHFTGASLLPEGFLAPGLLGQINSAARLSATELAISLGYLRPGKGAGGAIVLVTLRDGRWTTSRVIDMPTGVRDLAGGPGGTILAVTADVVRMKRDGAAPLVTILDSAGRVAGEWFDVAIANPAAAARNAHRARLQRLGNGSFALFDDASASVRTFDVVAEKDRYTATVRRTIAVGVLPPEAKSAPLILIKGVHVDAAGAVHIVRSFAGGDVWSTETIYGHDGSVVHRGSPFEYRAAYWIDDALNAVIATPDALMIERAAK